MAYGIRFTSGEIQFISDGAVLTSDQVAGLLGGSAELVWVRGDGSAEAVNPFQRPRESDGEKSLQ